jgi:hypothetical protein
MSTSHQSPVTSHPLPDTLQICAWCEKERVDIGVPPKILNEEEVFRYDAIFFRMYDRALVRAFGAISVESIELKISHGICADCAKKMKGPVQ